MSSSLQFAAAVELELEDRHPTICTTTNDVYIDGQPMSKGTDISAPRDIYLTPFRSLRDHSQAVRHIHRS